MHRRFALLGTVVLAAAAHAEDVQWKPARPLGPPPTSGGMTIVVEPSWTADRAARIGAPQAMPFPRVLPDAVADGPRLAPPAAAPETSLVITSGPPVPARPTSSILPGPEFDRRPSPYNSSAVAELPRAFRPSSPPTARLMPPAVPDVRQVQVPSQAPSFRLPAKPIVK